ncbi:TRAP transporter large permease [Salinicola corii]|uniref:TRAP transporter large permease protein n=1 Tax=Salinicola corii TaxID=2606937 RepID=A0A640WH54_9GAMM|nr:TRAP transporter large permease [Salinicola corii]KAA0019639.1 TRAP transporter large permease [Salinicola corii]
MNWLYMDFIVLLPLLLLLGVPIFVSLGIVGMLAAYLMNNPMVFATQGILNGLENFALLAIPSFILAGNIMEKGGITGDIIRIFRKLFGHIHGSLGIVTIFSCMFFAAISGSGPGTVAAIGAIMIPAMQRQGYPAPYAASVAATGGTLGVMIPPSNPLILYGVIANVSIADLFAAGVIPGVMISFLLAGMAYLMARRSGAVAKSGGDNDSRERQPLGCLLWEAKFSLFLPVLILGGIYLGFFTPVEASVCAVVYALVVSFAVYRQITLEGLIAAVESTVKLSGALMIIVACSTLFAKVIAIEQIPQQFIALFSGVTESPIVLLLIICAVLLVIGTFMETLSSIIILAPILVPLVESYGIDPVLFGILLVVTNEIAFLTPPLGVNLFVASQIADIGIGRLAIAVLPFLAVLVLALLILIFFPSLTLWLPTIIKA